MESHVNESDLLARAIAGEQLAMEKLLRAHSRELTAYISRHLPSDVARVVQPQDVLQDVFFEAFRRIQGFTPRGENALYRWLVSIARNRLVDVLRSHRRIKRGGAQRLDFSGDDSIVTLLHELAVYERTPSRSAASHELCVAVDSTIERLPRDWATAIRLHHIQGLSVREAAAQMNRTEGAFQMLCNRALKKLRIEMRSSSLYI